jgi:hypothetical protein
MPEGVDKQDDKPDDERGRGFPQILHDRARTAAEELHKLLLSLSTGGVAVYFLGLTGKIEPRLTTSQIATVLVATIGFAGAGLSGITCWYADCRRNYFWASALQTGDKLERSKFYRQRDRWLRTERVTANLLIGLFVLGVLVSALYVGFRLLGV